MEEALKADVVMMLSVQLERHETGIILSAEQYREHLRTDRGTGIRLDPSYDHHAPGTGQPQCGDRRCGGGEQPVQDFHADGHGVPVRMAVMERALTVAQQK